MTLRPLLHDRLGYDAIYAQSVVIVLCGVAVEALAYLLIGALMSGRMPSELRFIGPEELFAFAVAGAWFLTTASLGYGLAFALCQSLDLWPWLARVLALLAAPLGSALATLLLYAAMRAFDGSGYGPSLLEALWFVTLLSYAILGLPMVAAAILAARRILKTRIDAEATFGGAA